VKGRCAPDQLVLQQPDLVEKTHYIGEHAN
jgi:hypothetical protein